MNTFLTDLLNELATYYTDLLQLMPKLALATVIFTILFFIARKVGQFAKIRLTEKMDDPLLAKFLARIIRTLIILFAILVFLRIVGLSDVAAGLITGASVSAIVVGFAFKDIGENLLAGIMLAFHRPFRIDDSVELGGHTGKVVSLNLRNTQIKNPEGKDIFIPNAKIIKNAVINNTIDGFIRQDFIIGIKYGADVPQAIQIILNELASIPGILQEGKSPAAHIDNLSANTLNIKAHYWLDIFDKKVEGTKIKTEAINKTLSALSAAGYNML